MSCQVPGTSVLQRLLKPESGKVPAEGQVVLQWERTGPARSGANMGCHPCEPEEYQSEHQAMTLYLDILFSIFLIVLRRVWRAMCSPWVVVGSCSICRLTLAAASCHNSVGPRPTCRAEQVVTVLSVSHLIPQDLAVWVKKGDAFHRLGFASSISLELRH